MKVKTKIAVAFFAMFGSIAIAYINGYFGSNTEEIPTSEQRIDSSEQAIIQDGNNSISTQTQGDSNVFKNAGRDINEVAGDQNSAGGDINIKK